jgi:probable FeS assembly SUF system protein SufT
MSGFKEVEAGEMIQFFRDTTVTQIPSGDPLTVRKGTQGMVTQTLGGNVTLQIPAYGALARIGEQDLDALYPPGTQIPKQTKKESTGKPGEFSAELVWNALKTCYDPEIPLNIVDLGLIYDLQVQKLDSGEHLVEVKMTLTAQGCGMGATIAGDAEAKIARIPGVAKAKVEVVWDPPWNSSMISESGKKLLGIDE